MTRPNVTLEVYNVIDLLYHYARSCARWENFFHIARMLEADLKLPNVHFRKETAFIFL